VKIGNKILRITLVSFPIEEDCRRKKTINPKAIVCKIPKMQKMLFFIFSYSPEGIKKLISKGLKLR